MFATNVTEKTFSIKVFCFYMHTHRGGPVRSKITTITTPMPLINLDHILFNSISNGAWNRDYHLLVVMISNVVNSKSVFAGTSLVTQLAIIAI